MLARLVDRTACRIGTGIIFILYIWFISIIAFQILDPLSWQQN